MLQLICRLSRTLLLIGLLGMTSLAGCASPMAPGAPPTTVATSTVALQPANPSPISSTPHNTQTPGTKALPTSLEATPPVPRVSSSSKFTNLSDAQKLASFPIMAPTDIPDNLPLAEGWVFNFEDGSQTVRILFADPESPAASPDQKAVDVQLTKTNAPVTLDSVTHQFRETALDVREVEVRGSVGYTYWSPSAAMLNYAVLIWREGSLNFRVTLFGDWPQPTAVNPHGLDQLLLRIGESLKPA